MNPKNNTLGGLRILGDLYSPSLYKDQVFLTMPLISVISDTIILAVKKDLPF